jgi:replicative DNA helicase
MTNNFPVPSESVEAGLLNASLSSMTNWLEVSSFTSDDFSAHRDVYQFIVQYLSQYGQLPSPSTLSTRFQWQPPIGDFHYWLVEMKRYVLARQVLDAIKEGYEKITEPTVALSFMLEKLSMIRSLQTNHIQATDAGAAMRLELFDYRTENYFNNNRMIGLRTGFKVIDHTLIGWMPGSLVGCYARPSIGKTWWLLWQGLMAWLDGKTVLAITPEMPANQLNYRVDTLAANALGRPLDYGKLLVGDPSIRDDYEWITNIMAQSQRWWTYDSIEEHSLSLGDIAALIRQHQPECVLIDGISLLRNESRSTQAWQQMKELCYGLKNLATIHEVPIIMTHQASNTARGRHVPEGALSGRGDDFLMPSLNDAAFGDAFVQACSDVITMVGDQYVRNVTWYAIKKSRERGWQQELPARMGLATDFGHGKIIDLSELGYSPENVGREAKRMLGIV